MKSPKPKTPRPYTDRQDPELVFAIAERFHKTGVDEAKALVNGNAMNEEVPAMATGIVNLTFSIELYLKALHLLCFLKPADGHELLDLFNSLPPIISEFLAEDYSRMHAVQGEYPAHSEALPAFNLVISVDLVPDDKKIEVANMGDIKELLSYYNRAFTKLRYLYEPNGGYDYLLDFNSLHTCCKVLQNVIPQMVSVTSGSTRALQGLSNSLPSN